MTNILDGLDLESPFYLMLVGLPASGKTTLRNTLRFSKSNFPVVISTDDFLEKICEYTNKTYNEIFKDFIKAAERNSNRDLEDCVQNNKSMIDDRTNLSVKSRAKKLYRIPAHYKKYCIYVNPKISDEEWYARLDSRPGKIIPHSVLVSMVDSIEAPTKKEGFEKVLYLYP